MELLIRDLSLEFTEPAVLVVVSTIIPATEYARSYNSTTKVDEAKRKPEVLSAGLFGRAIPYQIPKQHSP